jgi:urease accessory protein
MIVLTRIVPEPTQSDGVLRLAFEWRQKSRCRIVVAEGRLAGEDVGLDLPRGTVLRDGDCLASDAGAGEVFRVSAAVEQLLEVRAPDPVSLTRIAYHLGNRHVPVQVGDDGAHGWLRIQMDHVLENMVVGLGGRIVLVAMPFDPEGGAYGHGGHRHGPAEERPHGSSGRHDDRMHAPRIHDFLDPPR